MSIENTNSLESDKEKRNILNEEGSTRAVVSGAYSFLFAIVGSLLLWIFAIVATGNPGLAYYGLVFAILGIFQGLSTGFGLSFIPKVKAALVDEGPEKALIKAATYVKVYMFIGIIMVGFMVISIILIPDPFIQFCLIMAVPLVILTYLTAGLGNMLSVENRYDITAFIGCFFGIIVFIVGIIFIFMRTDAWTFALIPMFIGANAFILSIIFYRRVSPFSLKELYTNGELFSDDAKEFIKYSSFSTLTNLESIGVLGNLIVYITTIALALWYPSSTILAVQIIVIVMTYAIVKVAIIFFAGPLNIEVAEAVAKENHEIVQDSITDIGRTSLIIGLTLTMFVCAGAGHILTFLHPKLFIMSNGEINQSLLITSIVLLILCTLGQAFYGYAALFGNALIGAGKAKASAIGFGITLILAIVLTPILVFLFGFLGAGIAMFVTGLFILPFMLIAVKKILKVNLNFKFFNHIPHLTIAFLLIFFFPLRPVLDHIFMVEINYPIAIIGMAMLLGIIFAFIIGIPFFGVLGPEDVKMIKDISQQFNVESIGDTLIKIGRFFYYLNPLHKKSSS